MDDEDGWEDEDEGDRASPEDFNFVFRSRGGAEFPNFGGGRRGYQRSQFRRYGGFSDADDMDIFEVTIVLGAPAYFHSRPLKKI